VSSKSGGIVALGEVLLRLAPPAPLLLNQARSLAIEVGGAEANVLAGLAALGHRVRLVSALPENPLGDLAAAVLAGRGIDTGALLRLPGRMGLYFLEPGHGRRPARIVYDRQVSAFAQAGADSFNLAAAMQDARLLHLSGITPALGPQSAALALAAARFANAQGVPVSFDGNFRTQLWRAWDGRPEEILPEIIACADIMIGNHRDISLVTGARFTGEGETRRRAAAESAFAAFPRLKLVASTARRVIEADCHAIAARIDSREGNMQTEEIEVSRIVDRIGTGDAFAAGVIHSWLGGSELTDIARTGLALCVLKHGVAGDAAAFTAEDSAAFWEGAGDVRR
jgi:2-dehydro-3-deoxygluconokinase